MLKTTWWGERCPGSDRHADQHYDLLADGDRNRDQHGDSDPNSFVHCNSDSHCPYRHSYRDRSYGNCHCYCPNCDCQQYCSAKRYSNTYSVFDGNPGALGDQYTAAQPDGDQHPDRL